MLYALGAALLWGAACGFIHLHFWVVFVGGLLSAALAIWLEWEALKQAGGQRKTFGLMLAAAYIFLVMFAVGAVSMGYYIGEWLRFQLH